VSGVHRSCAGSSGRFVQLAAEGRDCCCVFWFSIGFCFCFGFFLSFSQFWVCFGVLGFRVWGGGGMHRCVLADLFLGVIDRTGHIES